MLISEIDTNSDILTICDPDGDSRGSWTISISELVDLMDKKWDGNERGFVIIKGTH